VLLLLVNQYVIILYSVVAAVVVVGVVDVAVVAVVVVVAVAVAAAVVVVTYPREIIRHRIHRCVRSCPPPISTPGSGSDTDSLRGFSDNQRVYLYKLQWSDNNTTVVRQQTCQPRRQGYQGYKKHANGTWPLKPDYYIYIWNKSM
jgi:hypothetical protein